jgi:hypothetical protein
MKNGICLFILLSLSALSSVKAQANQEFRPCRNGDLFGYCDPTGKVLLPHVYQKAGPFYGNIAPVVIQDGYWWYINKEGHLRFNTHRWADQVPLFPEKGLYKVSYFDPIFAQVTEFYNKNGLPVKVWREDSLSADTIPYKIFQFSEAAQLAKSRLGTPYGQDQMDCSGFIRFIFQPFGIVLPYYAREIAEAGREIDRTKIKPGDLVFFAGSNAQDKTVNHVGFVLSTKANEIEFIHASTSKGVVVNKSTDPYYKIRFLFARRIFG